MDISLYTDCAVLMAALGSGLYCLKLRREIRHLTANKKGLRAALHQMTDATVTAQEALSDIKEQVRVEIEELDGRLVQIGRAREEVEDMLDSADGQVAYQRQRMKEAAQLAEGVLAPLMRQAETQIASLSQLQSRPEDRQPRPAYRSSPRARSLYEPTEDTATREDNPFLKAVHG
jgi:predicted nuclease with TOPRIM domain